jgi:ElaB/YqjD/DUF883 family membrane-anchored ribosome-binding protein
LPSASNDAARLCLPEPLSRATRCICDAGVDPRASIPSSIVEEVRMRNGALHSPLKNLRKDLYAVARDAEALLKATAEVTNDRVQEVRERTEKTLQAAFDHLDQDRLRAQVRRVYETTDDYVRERPWAMIGAAAGVGLLIGLLLRRD